MYVTIVEWWERLLEDVQRAWISRQVSLFTVEIPPVTSRSQLSPAFLVSLDRLPRQMNAYRVRASGRCRQPRRAGPDARVRS